MKKLLFAALTLIVVPFSHAQINAITETGDEVILSQDGTWAYKNDSLAALTEIPVNEDKFEKDDKSTFLVKSKKIDIGIWINPKKWSFTKGSDLEAYEFQFQKKGEDLYAMLVAENIEMPIETLRDVAYTNAKSVSSDIKIIHEEYRIVNGTKLLMLQMAGTIQGIKFTYYGYYLSDKNRTVQLLAYTGTNLFEEFLSDIELFLNGLVLID